MKRKNNASSWPRLGGCLLLLLLAFAPVAGAELQVTGLGWIGNRTAEQRLKLLFGERRGEKLDANAIEDAALVLISSLNEQGYLEPGLTVDVTLANGQAEHYPLDARLEHPLPRPLTANGATLHFERGQRFTITEVHFSGLTSLTEKEARTFFIGADLLLPLASERIYSASLLQRGASNLEEALRQQGFAEATVALDDIKIDHPTGKVRAAVRVQEGARWRVNSMRFEISDGSEAPGDTITRRVGEFWTSVWRQDTANAVRRWYYSRGHPDVQLTVNPQPATAVAGTKEVAVVVQVTPGPQVHVGKISFVGNHHTNERILRRLVRGQPDALLNPIRYDNAQARLTQLGIFRNVNLSYEPPTGLKRDVLYELTEGQRREIDLLAGYGSYDQFRGGVEWKEYNLFGLAHSSDLKLVQSVKSTEGEYVYTVPELFGSATNGSIRLFGLQRQEFSFVREEYGANVSLLWPVRPFGFSVTTGYTFKHLRDPNNELGTKTTDIVQTDVASVDVGLVRDRRDNPLSPHKGYKMQVQLEAANRGLGGQVVYQQLVAGASYHTAWGSGRWLHFGVSHGVVTTFGAPNDADLPVSVLFYPGGDGSIRGYQKGAAAPRDASGQFVGAKSYVQANLELEQALTSSWSVVGFVDGLGITPRLDHYPFSEELYSIGLGLRYQTIIGPVRLEYGHNLNPRPRDPPGTLQLSVGYPF